MSRPLKVFLCHAHADAKAVRTLYDRLVADGVDAWLDKEKLIPGQDWEREIRKAVREADVVIVCLSKQFNQRGYRQKEVRIALDEAEMMPEGEIFIIPARLEECENLESLRKWHWVDLYEKSGYEKLLRSLQFRAKKVGAELVPKKNLIAGAFRKPIAKRKNISEPKEQAEAAKENSDLRNKKTHLRKRFEKSTGKEIQRWGIGILIFALLYFAIFILPSYFSTGRPLPQATFTQTQKTAQISTEIIIEPSVTPVPSRTILPENTPTITITPTPAFGIGSTMVSEKDQMTMMFIPEGEFIMGVTDENIQQIFNDCASRNQSCTYADNTSITYIYYSPSWETKSTLTFFSYAELRPAKNVFLDSFWIDKTEVTNKMYLLCVEDGTCNEPQQPSYLLNAKNFDDPEVVNQAVEFVFWEDARTYCEWAGKRLPSDAEWEKAARGTDGRLFPWGNADNECEFYSSDVLSCPEKSSPYGVFNMDGSFRREWVNDWYDKNYLETIPLDNPKGPETGTEKIIRPEKYILDRDSYTLAINDHMAFRCAKDAP